MPADSYADTLHYLYRLLPDYQRTGRAAGKIDLSKTYALCEALGNPQDSLRCVHVAGTNGKGTVSHLLASCATASGLRTGLYTSPHYVDFRERIRVDGELVPETWVVGFVAEHRALIEGVGASFFEFTVAMAFAYFSEVGVDVAVIEVGLGGRLDSTNVIAPEGLLAAVITNIDLDHTEFLGDTRAAIAREKAGIIKAGRPVVVGERQAETLEVFREVALRQDAPLTIADEVVAVREDGDQVEVRLTSRGESDSASSRRVRPDLHGPFRRANLLTAVAAWSVVAEALRVPQLPPASGLTDLARLSGYRGRFVTLRHNPRVIADAGHNPAAWERLGSAIAQIAAGRPILVVCGFVRGKAHEAFFASFPLQASFFVGAPGLPRAVSAEEVVASVGEVVRYAGAYGSIGEAYDAAMATANPTDVIFVGGSTFVVGALFEHLEIAPA